MPYEFKLTRRVEFAETDMAGIVHFSNFFRMMEATEHAFFRSLGFSIHSAAEGATVGWPRVSAACDYQRPLRFEEEVEIQLLVAEVRSRSIRYQFVFRQPGTDVEIARGNVAAVCATWIASRESSSPSRSPGHSRSDHRRPRRVVETRRKLRLTPCPLSPILNQP